MHDTKYKNIKLDGKNLRLHIIDTTEVRFFLRFFFFFKFFFFSLLLILVYYHRLME